MENIKNSSLRYREESNGYLVYNHRLGSAHLVTLEVLGILKEYNKNEDKIIEKAKKDPEIKEILNILSKKRLI